MSAATPAEALALAAHRHALGYITRRDLVALVRPEQPPASADLAAIASQFQAAVRAAGLAGPGVAGALEREWGSIAAAIDRGERAPLSGAIAAWRVALAAAGATSHALRTWFARTPEQAAQLLAAPRFSALVGLGRECALLEALVSLDEQDHAALVADITARIRQAVCGAASGAPARPAVTGT